MPTELGVHNLTFEMDALQAILELAADRCHLVGGVGQYEAIWRMAAVRGPQGLSVNLASSRHRTEPAAPENCGQAVTCAAKRDGRPAPLGAGRPGTL